MEVLTEQDGLATLSSKENSHTQSNHSPNNDQQVSSASSADDNEDVVIKRRKLFHRQETEVEEESACASTKRDVADSATQIALENTVNSTIASSSHSSDENIIPKVTNSIETLQACIHESPCKLFATEEREEGNDSAFNVKPKRELKSNDEQSRAENERGGDGSINDSSCDTLQAFIHECPRKLFLSEERNKLKRKLKSNDEQSRAENEKGGDGSINDSSCCYVEKKGHLQPRTKLTENVVGVSLIPERQNVLSNYNLILTENIELFEVSKSYNTSDGAVGICTDGLPRSKVGLRCMHCLSHGRHVTAASFFPSSISSIASGVGTIGARHFIGGKCPYAPKEMLERLRQSKKASQQQTRMHGRVGLDAYCRNLAKQKNIKNLDVGGIQVCTNRNEATMISVTESKKVVPRKTIFSRRQEKLPSSGRKTFIINRNDPSAFIQGSVEHFWECKHCNSLPYHWRASGSVVFSADAPSFELVSKHLSVCQGKTPLCIPRDATIQTKEGENGLSVLIRWESQDKNHRKSGRIQRRLLATESGTRKRSSSMVTRNVREDVEDEVLAFPDDKSLTSDFAHFTVLQLKKCYLTKAGGSRGNCPVGYPGLACVHCAGTATPRKFFYTSADHLRNSFSHIPSHLANCGKCPNDVKQKIEEFKSTRNKQKSQLKSGDHKQFIDRVWERLHGSDGGIIDVLQDDFKTAIHGEFNDDDSSVSSLSVDAQPDFHRYNQPSVNSVWLESDHISIEPTPSALVFIGDRKEVADYTYYSMLQMAPKKPIRNDKNKEDDEINSQSGDKHSTIGHILDSTSTSASVNQNNDSSSNESGGQKDTETKIEGVNEQDKQTEESYTIVCKYCNDGCGQDWSSPSSADELRLGFSDIPQHLLLCTKCPNDVKEKLKRFKSLRATQEAFLKRGAQKQFMETIWDRLERHFTEPVRSLQDTSQFQVDFTREPVGNVSTPLLAENDRKLVTQFTFFTMEQMEPCSLEKSGNGSRSMFHYGFPGLSCIHCAGTPSARKFFYRTSDILSGNYAHIPNHVLSCKHCPTHIKKLLAAKKKGHAHEKMRLHRGSQRVFFNNIWERLHRRQT